MTPGYILVVEDDEDLRHVVCDVLRDEGHETVAVANGLDALAYLRAASELPRIILLDLMMPVMDGRTFREQQRGDARLAAVPVVAMSAGRDLAGNAVTADAVLLKPVTIEVLLETIARVAGE
jgi:CheY-like chemotaxis protein